MSEPTRHPDLPWDAVQRGALTAGAAGLGVWALAGLLGTYVLQNGEVTQKAFYSYLFAFSFALTFPLGSLAIWMIHNQTGGAWGLAIRRILEAWTRCIWVLAVLFVPVALGVYQLYTWTDTTQFHEPHVKALVERKLAWLNVPRFLGFAALYFAVWIGMAWWLNMKQAAYDRAPDPAMGRGLRVFSGPGLGVYGITLTFAAIDWLMSLEADWYSTIFGFLYGAGQMVPALSFAIAAAAWIDLRFRPPQAAAADPHLALQPPEGEPIDHDTWNDLGNLLLASVMVWAYISFSQLLLIWMGNLSEEIPWYLRRIAGGWQVVSIALAFFYFGLPFLLLLSRSLKRDRRRLLAIASMLVVVSALHHYWLIMPVHATIVAEHHEIGSGVFMHWLDPVLDLGALVGVAGVAFGMFVRALHSRPLTPPAVVDVEEEAHHG